MAQNSRLTVAHSGSKPSVSSKPKKSAIVTSDPVTDSKESAKVAGLRYVNVEGPGITRRRRGKVFTTSASIRSRYAINILWSEFDRWSSLRLGKMF